MHPVRPKGDRNYSAEFLLATLQSVLSVYAAIILRLPWWGQILFVVGAIVATAVLVGIVTGPHPARPVRAGISSKSSPGYRSAR
jgi:hypothetical protein